MSGRYSTPPEYAFFLHEQYSLKLMYNSLPVHIDMFPHNQNYTIQIERKPRLKFNHIYSSLLCYFHVHEIAIILYITGK